MSDDVTTCPLCGKPLFDANQVFDGHFAGNYWTLSPDGTLTDMDTAVCEQCSLEKMTPDGPDGEPLLRLPAEGGAR